MRDGVRLATDVYLPEPSAGADQATYPAVLIRLPYDKNSRYVFVDGIARRFTARGYALVVQDVRGKFRSGGTTLPFLQEPQDGYDSIDWITHQAWSDGRVGMFGDSYYGFTQWAAVAARHPALRAIVPRMTSADFNRIWKAAGPGQPDPPVWLEGVEYFAHHWIDNDTYDYEPDRTRRPVIDQYEQAFRAIGARSLWFDLLAPRHAGMPTRLGPDPFDALPVPVLHCVGWYDNIGAAHMRDHAELASRPAWAATQYLWAGAVDHENYWLGHAPVADEDDHNADEAALERMLPGYTDPAIEFFDVFLKEDRPATDLPRVRWELGHQGWRTAEAWPPPGSDTRTFWLADPATAAHALPGGALTRTPPTEERSAQWVHDPDEPVPSLVENSFAHLHTHPDFAPVAAREDVLAFTAPASSGPLDLAGPVTVEVHVTSTAPVFDVFAKLLDLAPDGDARLIVRGQVSAEATVGSDEAISIDLGHTGYRLRHGHRLALILAASDFPLYLPTTGTGENPWTAVTTKPGTQTLRTGGVHPSRLTLTVLPPSASPC
ncbi:CocE/NonD family hydrolase [Streptomyces spongiae]|uniref:CocE/NonD family hydrolase n=2 Tax=Streptomyces spongiae TaxID=565072 RepID=A0A5N8XBB4_9ACTN|nr:CocE/NonD family hydrolase [Streptomyces spongiae]